MPNLIEQQDLLKGLTDQRLSALLQQPTGDIPPFLVAAEAQRRQNIRSQFSGGPDKNESVVDSLTRQMAGTPQDVNANPAAPATPPAAPEQAGGIAGLQPGMAAGGPVRRFAYKGYVDPNESYYQDPFGIPYVPDSTSSIGQSFSDAFGSIGDSVTSALQALPHSPVPKWEDPSKKAEENNSDGTLSKPFDITYKDYPVPQNKPVTKPTEKPTAPRDPTSGVTDTSLSNKYKAQRAEFRNRAEALMGDGELSSWERAQKWFDVSQQFFNPEATAGETIANAIGAFGSGMARENAAKREAEAGREEKLLAMDMQFAKEDRDAEIAAQNRAYERATKLADRSADQAFQLKKMQTPEASSAIRALGDLIDGIDKQLESGEITDQATKDALLRQRQSYEKQLSTIMSIGGFSADTPTRDDLEAAVNNSFPWK